MTIDVAPDHDYGDEEEAAQYAARAQVLLVPGPDRDDFVAILRALGDIFSEEGTMPYAAAEEATDDLASVLESM